MHIRVGVRVVPLFEFRAGGNIRCASVCRPRSGGRGLQCQERAVPRREAPVSRSCRRAAELADSDCSVLPGQRLRQPCVRPSRWAGRDLNHALGRRCSQQRLICGDSDAAALVLTRQEISDRRDAHVVASHGRRATCACTQLSRNLQQMRIFVGIPDARASAVTSNQSPLATRSHTAFANQPAARHSARRPSQLHTALLGEARTPSQALRACVVSFRFVSFRFVFLFSRPFVGVSSHALLKVAKRPLVRNIGCP